MRPSATRSRAQFTPRCELILGGQKSGKSRAAEARAQRWLGESGREAILIATAQPGDLEMTERIARHRADRAVRVPGLVTLEESSALAQALTTCSTPSRLVVVDCLTLWLTQLALPLGGPPTVAADLRAPTDAVVAAVCAARGPIVLVSNEIGLGIAPLSAEARAFADVLGLLHQSLAAISERVTLMVAGCEWVVRGAPR